MLENVPECYPKQNRTWHTLPQALALTIKIIMEIARELHESFYVYDILRVQHLFFYFVTGVFRSILCLFIFWDTGGKRNLYFCVKYFIGEFTKEEIFGNV